MSKTYYGSAKNYAFELTLLEMEELFGREHLREKVFGLLDELFGQTYVNKAEVTLVKPFGGTSRMKYVLDLLTEYFGADIFDSDDYEWEDSSISDVAAGAARYLGIRTEQNDEFEIISEIPFSIGLARGQAFKKYLDRCPPYGQRTRRISLSWPELAGKEYRVSVFQSFADSENVAVGGQDGAVYVGSVKVDPDLYKGKDAILLEMELTDSSTLKMIFSELGESGVEERETQFINLRSSLDNE